MERHKWVNVKLVSPVSFLKGMLSLKLSPSVGFPLCPGEPWSSGPQSGQTTELLRTSARLLETLLLRTLGP